MTDRDRCLFVLKSLLKLVLRNTVRNLVVFRVCRTLETFSRTPRPHQHQKIHLQHKIKIIKFSTHFSNSFGIDFRRKIDAFCNETLIFPNTLTRKGRFHYEKHHFSHENRSQNHMKNMSKIL